MRSLICDVGDVLEFIYFLGPEFFLCGQHIRQDQVLKPQLATSIWGKQNQEKAGWLTQQNQQDQLQSQNCVRNTGFESGRCGRPVTLPHSAWHSLHSQPQNQPPRHTGPVIRPVILGGSGMKSGCAGTGVFLPRRYGGAADLSKKMGIC